MTEAVRAAYDIAEVLDNFDALLRGVDFDNEMQMLGIGRFSLFARRDMLLELRALYIALWYLALQRSFPDAAEKIFEAFLQRHTARAPRKPREALLRERAQQYNDMLRETGDRDFTAVSRHLLSQRRMDESALKPLSLRLALHLRSTYTFIFDRLI